MNGAPDNDDLFEKIARERGIIPPGDYLAELMVATPFETARTKGADALIKIINGKYADRLVKIRLMEEGPPSCNGIISTNALMLDAWWKEIDTPGRPLASEGFLGVLAKLWQWGQGDRLYFTFDVRSSPKFGAENILTEVRRDEL
jgi:hypothetical protein